MASPLAACMSASAMMPLERWIMASATPTPPTTPTDRWHHLLTTRFVCEICLTRFFVLYRRCPACHRAGRIRPLKTALLSKAQSDEELRNMIAGGQMAAASNAGAGIMASAPQSP